MLKLAADECFSGIVVGGLLRRDPSIDIVRVQDIAEVAGADDATLLEWAAREGRLVLTYDVSTLVPIAHARVASGSPMPGVFIVVGSPSDGLLINELHVIATCSHDGEWEGRVTYLPL